VSAELEAQLAHVESLKAQLASCRERLEGCSVQRRALKGEVERQNADLAYMAERVEGMGRQQRVLDRRVRAQYPRLPCLPCGNSDTVADKVRKSQTE
jgi:predicted nuclease with TOPRIM domain